VGPIWGSIFGYLSSQTTGFVIPLICWFYYTKAEIFPRLKFAPRPTFIHMSDVRTCPLMTSSLYRPELLCSRRDDTTPLWRVKRDSCDDDAVRVWCAPIDAQDVRAVECTVDRLLLPVESCGCP
jgi:hypothetical protein